MNMSTQANVSQLQGSLNEYLRKVEAGEEIVIYRNELPFAKIVPLTTEKRVNLSRPGSMAGTVEILGDITGPAVPDEDFPSGTDSSGPV